VQSRLIRFPVRFEIQHSLQRERVVVSDIVRRIASIKTLSYQFRQAPEIHPALAFRRLGPA